MDLEQIKQLTRDFGQGWADAHARRVLKLIEIIAAGISYNQEAIQHAAYLHDWGAFPKYFQPGVGHAQRSRQVAEVEILPFTSLPSSTQVLVADAIDLHDYRDQRPATSTESLLLREADALDMLGVIGIAREFAWGPNDLQKCYNRIMARRALIPGCLTLPAAQQVASRRLAEMDRFLISLQEESFGIL
jgi:HD superfamily phosphodiesterase